MASGRRLLALAGLQARGFVAPAYAYTPALRRELAASFDWWATLMRVWTARDRALAPALGVGGSNAVKRALSPPVARAGALAAGHVLRLDLHPGDFDRPRHVLALERLLRRASTRRPVTYDDLC